MWDKYIGAKKLPLKRNFCAIAGHEPVTNCHEKIYVELISLSIASAKKAHLTILRLLAEPYGRVCGDGVARLAEKEIKPRQRAGEPNEPDQPHYHHTDPENCS